MKIRRLFNYKVLLGLIVLVGLWLRVVNLRSWFHFEMDEEVIAYKVNQFIQFGKPFLIGGGTPFGVHVGPLHYYLSSFFIAVTKMDPIGWGIGALIFSAATLLLCFAVGKLFYRQRVGIFLMLFWGISYVATMSDRHWWPLTLHPLLSLSTALAYYKVILGKKRWWIVLGGILGFAWQAELSTGILYLAVIPLILTRLKRDWRQVLILLAILLISLTPLVIFEFRHPGENIGKLLSYQSPQSETSCRISRLDLCAMKIGEALVFSTQSLSSLLFPLASTGNLYNFYTWCEPIAKARVSNQPLWATIAAAAVLLSPFIRWWKKKNSADGIISILILSGFGSMSLFSIFGGNLFDFYLSTLYPIFLLSAAKLLSDVWIKNTRYIGIVIIILFLGINIFSLVRTYHPQSLDYKQDAISWVAGEVKLSSFALESLSRCSRYNGIRYLFMLRGIEPSLSFMDPNYFWLYYRLPDTSYPKIFIVFVTPRDLTPDDEIRYNELQRHLINRNTFGDFDVLIVNNEKQGFTINF